MDFGSDIVPIVIGLVVLAALILILRKRNPFVSSPVQIVNSLLSDVRINLRLVEVIIEGDQIKRFAVNGWYMHKNNIGFLRESLQKSLTEANELADAYTKQVAESNKQGKGYTGTIDAQEMKTTLLRCKSGLENWLMATTGTTDPGGKGGISGFFLGR